MQIPEIANFDDLLSEMVPPDRKVSNFKVRHLTAAGENYGSLILAIDINLRVEDGQREEETLHTVAKLLPSNDFMQEFMNIQFTVRNELGFYQTILPTLRNFQREQNSTKTLECFPRFHTGRLSLDESNKTVDENSIIILKNLKVAGYGLLDREKGFDRETTELILTKMSELHGTVIALKETQPEVFNEKILPYFDEFLIFQMGDNDGFMTSEVVINAITRIVEGDDFCSRHMDRIREMIKTCVSNLGLPKNSQKFQQDVFASLIHDDLWVNNVMVKIQEDKVVDVKMLDWQLYEYASVVKDILFFLCSSAREDIFLNELDSLINFYYESLIQNLKELNCDTEKFAFDVFQEELKRVANEVAFFNVMIALPSILASDDQVWEVHELTKERMLGQFQGSEVCRKRICLITKKFIENGWI